MEIQGKIIMVLPKVEGIAKSGNAWKKQEYILETESQYPKKVMFTLFGDKVDQFVVNVGETVLVSYDLESREYNGRWYTEVRAWKVDRAVAGAPMAPPAVESFTAPAASSPTDDLPF